MKSATSDSRITATKTAISSQRSFSRREYCVLAWSPAGRGDDAMGKTRE